MQLEKRSLLLGRVQYINYEKQQSPKGNPLAPMFFKRQSFELEKEVRLISWTDESNGFEGAEINDRHGVHINVDLKKIIDTLYIAPKAPNWFEETIKDILKKYNLESLRVKKSNLGQKAGYLSGLRDYEFREGGVVD